MSSEIGGLSEGWCRVGLQSPQMELAGVSGSSCGGCGLPPGACQYLFLIQVTISKGYNRESILCGLSGKIKHPVGNWYYKIIA